MKALTTTTFLPLLVLNFAISIFATSTGKHEKRALNFGIQAFSTSFYFSKSLNFLKFFFELLYPILQINVNVKLPVNGTYQNNLCTCQICQDISCICCCYHMLINFFCDLNFLHGHQTSMFKFCEDYYLHSFISPYFLQLQKKCKFTAVIILA